MNISHAGWYPAFSMQSSCTIGPLFKLYVLARPDLTDPAVDFMGFRRSVLGGLLTQR